MFGVYVCDSYVEVAEVAGAEGGISESVDAEQTPGSHHYFCGGRQDSFSIIS